MQTATSANDDIVLGAYGIELRYPRPNQPANTVLCDFSLELAKGEILAILGPSGVGKSSLLRVLAGLQAASQGTIQVNGGSLHGPHPRLGFVFQDASLLPWLNLQENVGFGLDFKHQPAITKAEKQQRVQAAIADVDLLGAQERYPSELSGGMAQRTALARSLARQPEILLLDEPFSALDEITRADMQTLLLQITAKYDTSAILVTHDIDEALTVADRILLIGQSPGRLIGEWRIDDEHPRDIVTTKITAIRVEITQALREARNSTKQQRRVASR
ncbi:MAG: ABC transporter ATP-binding protein [Burkholderiaceae bacterium]|nr:MAG: ABC transporter ATP-binding protein [Burkholderiaceae bacterium]TAM01605.1 MAG: ABC transporter ATP-binding protein [Pusillimonas sp.]